MNNPNPPLTAERRAEIESRAAKIFEIFGDDWHLIYGKDETEVECRADYTGAKPTPGAYIPIFSTTQWPDHDPTSPLAEFLARSIVDIPALLGEVDRLNAAVQLLGSELQRDSMKVIDQLKHEPCLPIEHVERFLKRERDQHGKTSYWWRSLDEALDTLRLHVATGTPLTEPCPQEGPEAPFVGKEPRTEAEELREEVERLRAETVRLTEERDLAIAHDRQPYPTQWAYDQACTALENHRQRADKAETERDRYRHALQRAALSVEHDRASRTCQERVSPIHDEDCPACAVQAALHPEQEVREP